MRFTSGERPWTRPRRRVRASSSTLLRDERARAVRFYFERDRERFIVARGVLRVILGGYLNRAPRTPVIFLQLSRKACLAEESDRDAIRFSVSHSHGFALYAFHSWSGCGHRPRAHPFRSGSRGNRRSGFFSQREVGMLRAFRTRSSVRRVLSAVGRARGPTSSPGRRTFSLPLDQFDVSLGPVEPRRVLSALNEIHPKPRVGLSS